MNLPEKVRSRVHRSGALIMLFLAWGCTARENDNGGFHLVQTDVTYGPNDRREREWRALMTALDRCHTQGFSDAQPAAPPETRCLDDGPDGCRRTEAHRSWACIGMGYQAN